MTGGLLQLVAVGIDSIFLTSNPSITLFKVVYRRYTNFSLTTRTKQIKNITDFDKTGHYILQKEADCIHKIWLNFNISDIEFTYGKPTKAYINEICSKYGFQIEYKSDIDNDIVTPDDYKNIINEINDFIKSQVDKNNMLIDIIKLNNEYWTDTNITTQQNNIIQTFKIKLDGLLKLYESEVYDSSGNIIVELLSRSGIGILNNQGYFIINLPFMTYIKLFCIKFILSKQNILDTNIYNPNQSSKTNFDLLNNEYYDYPEYCIDIFNGSEYGDKINNTYTFTINKNQEVSGNLISIEDMIYNNLDKYLRELLLMENNKNLYLFNSTDNNLQNIKLYNNKIYNMLFTIKIMTNNIIQGYNPNNLVYNKIIYNLLSMFTNLNTKIEQLTHNLQNQIFLKIQYKNLIDFVYYEQLYVYNYVYNKLYINNVLINPIDASSDLLINGGNIITYFYQLANYIFNMIFEAHQNNTPYNTLFYHIENKLNYQISPLIINNVNENYKIYSELLLRNYMIDLLNNKMYDKKIYDIGKINDIMYNEYLKELTYDLIGTQMYTDISGTPNCFFSWLYNNNNFENDPQIITTIDLTGVFYGVLQNLYSCFILLHLIESNIPNNVNYSDSSGNYMGDLSNISKYYGCKMIDYFNSIFSSQNNPLIPILNFNNVIQNTILYSELDTYKILNNFLTDSNIIYDNTSFSKNFVDNMIQTLHQNQYANIDILYTIILNTLISSSHHNIMINYNTIFNDVNTSEILNLFYNINQDYYKYIFFKTFTNNISDTNKFTTLLNSKINGLNDNIIQLFDKYNENKDLYQIYFSNNIINRITKLNYNIALIYENSFFIDYFSDISIWSKLLLNSDTTKDILQNLTFDAHTGDVVSIQYYFDASGIIRNNQFSYDENEQYEVGNINPGYNIYDAFISPLSDLVKNNIIFLNYIPLYLIRDIFGDLYKNISNYRYPYTKNGVNKIFKFESDDMFYFDYRDLTEYNPLNIVSDNINIIEAYDIIQKNLKFKNDLYKEFILNIMLKSNNDSTNTLNASGTYIAKNFQDLIFNQNLLKIADYEYLISFANNFLINNRIGLASLLRPENLININNYPYTYDPSNNLLNIYGLETDASDNFNGYIKYDSSGNPIKNQTKRPLYVPFIRGVIERIRIQLITMIYSDVLKLTNLDDYTNKIWRLNIYSDIIDKIINPILDNYIKFDNVNNIGNSTYSYNTYKNNAYNFTIITSNPLLKLSNTYKFGTPNFVQAPSSIWSYFNKMHIREFNLMFNDTLISFDYYSDKLGAFMKDAYIELKTRLQNIYTHQSSYNKLPFYYPNNYSQYYYSYNLTINNNSNYSYSDNFDIYESFYKSQDTNNLSYPVSTNGFDYYSLGDIGTLKYDASGYYYDIKTLDLSSIYYASQTKTLIDWYYTINTIMLSVDMRKSNINPHYDYITQQNIYPKYNFYLLSDGFGNYIFDNDTPNPPANSVSIAKTIPYYSNLLRIRNKKYDDSLSKKSLHEIIDYFNDYVDNKYLFYSDAEAKIADRVKNNILQNYYSFYESINYINNFIFPYNESNNNFNINFDFKKMQDIDINGNISVIEGPYYIYNKSRLFYDYFYTLDETTRQNSLNYINNLLSNLINNIDKYVGMEYFNNFNNISDLVKYMIYLIYNDILNDLYLNPVLNITSNYINEYDNLLNTFYEYQKLNYFNFIKNITIPRTSDIIINNETPIKFSYDLAYIDLLYHIPDYYTQTDILYYGSSLDIWLRNVIYKNPVKYCWVSELGYYLLEYCNFYLDELLIDNYNSNLLSLLDKIEGIEDYKRGIDILNGNTIYNTTYDTNNKGNINLQIPLKFYFCKNIALSIPMINLLYTKGIIKFKTRKLEDLLIYDKNAFIQKRPKIKCSATIQYIYLEEDERNRIAKSKMEFLIEKYRYCGIYKYNITNILDGKIRTQLRIADPTKYILWRMKITYENSMKNNYTWNKNGYLDDNYNQIKTTDSIKIYFNGSSREQGNSELFNLINPHMRCIGSLDEDEYMYIFALYPLLYQPTGTANMTNIEEVIIEHQLNNNFLKDLQEKGLNFEIEYWALGYNVLRFVSGMCAPIFYI